MVSLIKPFSLEHVHLLWQWMCESPSSNFDDGGPSTLEEFRKSFPERLDDDQTVIEVLDWRGVPIGAVGYRIISDEIAMLRGICFTRLVHGTGVAREAVSRILSELFESGIERVYAQYFATNFIIDRFLDKLGAADIEATCETSTTQDGEVVPVKTVVIDELHFYENTRSAANPQHRRAHPRLYRFINVNSNLTPLRKVGEF